MKQDYIFLREVVCYNKCEVLHTIPGPILLGLKKPVHILQLGTSVRNIVNMATIAVVDAQIKNQTATEEVVKRSPWWKKKTKDTN